MLSSIQDEKKVLINTGEIKKDKKLPTIKIDEIPYEIPENWKWCRLQDICVLIVDGDHNPPSGLKIKTNFMMLSALNINHNKLVNLDQVRYYAFVLENNYAFKRRKLPCLLVHIIRCVKVRCFIYHLGK